MVRSRRSLPVALAAVAVAAPLLLVARGAARCFVATGTSARHGDGTRISQRGQRVLRVARADGAVGLADAKARLMDLIDDEAVQGEVMKAEGRPTRGRVNEAIVQIERLNPTEEPVYSELLDGTWAVRYTASFAPGLFESPTRELALFLYGGGFSLGSALSSFAEGFWGGVLDVKTGSKTVRIEAGRDVEAVAEIERGGSRDSLRYSAELMPLSSRRMSEEIMSLELPAPLGKQDLPLELRRTILITYLDEDLMVVRDESGVPEVLVRELATVQPSAPAAQAAPIETEEEVAGNSSAADKGEDPLISEAA